MTRAQKAAAADMEKMMEKLEKMEQKLSKLDKLDDLQRGQLEIKTEIAAVKVDLNAVQVVAEENKKKVGGLEGQVRAIQKGEGLRENAMLATQMDKMSYFLRFQNVEEVDQEDLRAVMVKLLGEFVERDLDFMRWDIDQVYRVNSRYAIEHNVPREVHVKFVRRETRDEILRLQRGGALTYRGKEITILKQIPRQVREMRKKYYFLTNKLYQKGIGFRWLMPEGLMIFWEGKRKKITSVMEAKGYLAEKKSLLEGEDTGVEEGEVTDDYGAGAGATAMGDQGGGRGLSPEIPKGKRQGVEYFNIN